MPVPHSNGYLLEELGRVPSVGERLEREGVVIEVVEASDTQVLRARLTRAAGRGESREPLTTTSGDAEPTRERSEGGTRLVP